MADYFSEELIDELILCGSLVVSTGLYSRL